MDRILIADATEVLIGSGTLAGDLLPERPGRQRAAVLTQPGAAGYGRTVARSLRAAGLASEVRVLPDGDAAKTLEVVGDVYDWLADLGLHRGDTVVGVGGGAITDVAGFVAATYLRGVEAVYVATTLLGAVDASIGGKTGINRNGKNLVGAFHHPSRVVVDVDVLEALPAAIWSEGAAEAVKAGLIADPDLVALFEEHGRDAPLAEVVRRAVAVKAAVVAEDPTEQGRRAVLNYGHTIGHALEAGCGLTHGAAVAIGIVAAGAASERVAGFAEAGRQRALLESLGLPTSVSACDPERVRALLGRDKKRDEEGLRMVLLRSIGDAVVRNVDSATVDAALAAVAGA